MRPFSFIHAADLHLGSPFKGVGTALPEAAARLRLATFEAFGALVDRCLTEKVDFLLVAGDVFDYADKSLRAQLVFRDGLAKLAEAGIQSFVTLGNHDPADAWSARIAWPEGVHLFSTETVETRTVLIDGAPAATVSGISYRTRKEPRALATHFKAGPPDLFQIAMLHCNCGGQEGHETYAPCLVADLAAKGFDYWALGHVHTPTVLSTAPHIVYPGCLQGLSIREAGPRGCWQVTVSETRAVSLSFVPLDRLRWKEASLSITGLETLDDLDRALAEALDRLREGADGRPLITRLSLSGRGPLYASLRKPGVGEELLERARQLGEGEAPPVWVEKIGLAIQPEADLVPRAGVDDLLGQLLRQALDLESSPDALREALSPALSELYGHARLGRMLPQLSSEEMIRLLREATLAAYDLLEPDP